MDNSGNDNILDTLSASGNSGNDDILSTLDSQNFKPPVESPGLWDTIKSLGVDTVNFLNDDALRAKKFGLTDDERKAQHNQLNDATWNTIDTIASQAHGLAMGFTTIPINMVSAAIGGGALERQRKAQSEVTLQPGMISSAVGIDPKQSLEMSGGIGKAFNTLIPLENMERDLGRMKELGVPEWISSRVAPLVTEITGLAAFVGWEGTIRGSIKATPRYVSKIAKRFETNKATLNDIDKVNDILSSLKSKDNITPEEAAKIQRLEVQLEELRQSNIAYHEKINEPKAGSPEAAAAAKMENELAGIDSEMVGKEIPKKEKPVAGGGIDERLAAKRVIDNAEAQAAAIKQREMQAGLDKKASPKDPVVNPMVQSAPKEIIPNPVDDMKYDLKLLDETIEELKGIKKRTPEQQMEFKDSVKLRRKLKGEIKKADAMVQNAPKETSKVDEGKKPQDITPGDILPDEGLRWYPDEELASVDNDLGIKPFKKRTSADKALAKLKGVNPDSILEVVKVGDKYRISEPKNPDATADTVALKSADEKIKRAAELDPFNKQDADSLNANLALQDESKILTETGKNVDKIPDKRPEDVVSAEVMETGREVVEWLQNPDAIDINAAEGKFRALASELPSYSDLHGQIDQLLLAVDKKRDSLGMERLNKPITQAEIEAQLKDGTLSPKDAIEKYGREHEDMASWNSIRDIVQDTKVTKQDIINDAPPELKKELIDRFGGEIETDAKLDAAINDALGRQGFAWKGDVIESLNNLLGNQRGEVDFGIITRLHPAPFPKVIQKAFSEIIKELKITEVLDIFGGIGKIGKIKKYGYEGKITAVEIEPTWGNGKILTGDIQKKNGVDKTIIGDSRELDMKNNSVQAIVTSPTYGNAMALKSKSKKDSYQAFAGGKLQEGNTGGEVWGPAYEELHNEIYKEAYRVVKPGGYFILNMKDKPVSAKDSKNNWIPKKNSTVVVEDQVMKATDWHTKALEDAGFVKIDNVRIDEAPAITQQQKMARKYTVGYEDIVILQKPKRFSPLGNQKGEVILKHGVEGEAPVKQMTEKMGARFDGWWEDMKAWMITDVSMKGNESSFIVKSPEDVVRRLEIARKAHGSRDLILEKLKQIVDNEKGEITAWHGGRELEGGKFREDKVGSGQGLAAGWGVYLSDLWEVGKHYAEQAYGNLDIYDTKKVHIVIDTLLGDEKLPKFYKDALVNALESSGRKAYSVLESVVGEAKARKLLKDAGADYNAQLHKAKVFEGKKPEEYTWLDWDKSIGEQGKETIIKLKGVLKNLPTNRKYEYGKHPYDTIKELENTFDSTNGSTFYDTIADILGSKEKASKVLLDAGINGNRLPVGHFGGDVTPGKYNYVVFDTKDINVKRSFKLQGNRLLDILKSERGSFSFEQLPPDKAAELRDMVDAAKKKGGDLIEGLKKLYPRLTDESAKMIAVMAKNDGEKPKSEILDNSKAAKKALKAKEKEARKSKTAQEREDIYNPLKNPVATEMLDLDRIGDGKQFNKTRKDMSKPPKIIKKTVVGPGGKPVEYTITNVVLGEPVAKMVKNTAEINKRVMNNAGDKLEPMNKTLNQVDPSGHGIKRMISGDEALNVIMKLNEKEHEFTITQKKKVGNKGLVRIGDHLRGLEEGGLEWQKANGIKEVKRSDLSPVEIEVMDAFRERQDGLWHYINDARVKRGKVPMGYIKDYITRALSIIRLGDRVNLNNMSESLINDTVASEIRNPMAKARGKYLNIVGKTERNIGIIHKRYAKKAFDATEMSPVIARVKALLGDLIDPETGTTFRLANQKPRLARFLGNYANALARVPNFKMPAVAENWLNTFATNISGGMMIGSVRNTAVQGFNIRNGMVSIKPEFFVKGIANSLIHPVRTHKRGMEGTHMPLRLRNSGDINTKMFLDNVGLGPVQVTKDVAKFLATVMGRAIDFEVALMMHEGIYLEARKGDHSHPRALELASEMTKNLSGSSSFHDLSPIQQNALGRFGTILGTFNIGEFNWMWRDVFGIGDARKLGKAERMQLIAKFIAATTIMNYAAQGLKMQTPNPAPYDALIDSVEEDDSWPETAYEIASEFMEPFPLIGGLKYGRGFAGLGVSTMYETFRSGNAGNIPLVDTYQGIMRDKRRQLPATEIASNALATEGAKLMGLLGGIWTTSQTNRYLKNDKKYPQASTYQKIMNDPDLRKKKSGSYTPPFQMKGLDSGFKGLDGGL